VKLKRAREIFDHFPSHRILVLGDCMLDHWLWGSVSRISPEAPVPVVDIERSTYTPGGAANVVHNLCSLGAQAAIVGVVGRDDAARRLRGLLKAQGAEVKGLVQDGRRPTTTKTRIIAHSQQVVRADTELRGPINGVVASRMLKSVGAGLEGYEALLVSDYDKGVVSRPLLDSLVAMARAAGAVVVAGPKPENIALFNGDLHVDVVALNEKEARAVTGLGAETDEAAEKAARGVLDRTGAAAVLLTRGGRGMSLLEAGKRAWHVPAHARQVYDVSGAGDTVIAVLTLALTAGASLVEATQLANFAAAVVVEKVGTATASPEEILHVLRERA
jgi:rfaE bifunctional protein kinase chain/domain